MKRIDSPLFGGAGAPEVLAASAAAGPFARLRGYLEALRFQALLSEEVRQQAPAWQRVESHWLVPSALAVAIAAPGIPHTAYCHSGDVALLERLPGGDVLLRWLARRCDAIVCVSQQLVQRLRRLAAGDVVVNERTRFGRLPVATSFRPRREGAEFVLAVGRLVPIKGYDVLVRAIGRLPRLSRPPLVIVGVGPERDRLLRLAEGCRVDLQLPGPMPHDRICGMLARAAVCVIPSRQLPSGRTEGLPMIAREALAVGTPVVASASGGLIELARETAIALVPPDDPVALGRLLVRYPTTSQLRSAGGSRSPRVRKERPVSQVPVRVAHARR